MRQLRSLSLLTLLIVGATTHAITFNVAGFEPGGRCSAFTGVVAPGADQLAVTTLYYVPWKHDRVQLYNGTTWVTHQITQLSQLATDTTKSPLAAAASTNYDVYIWLDGSTVRLSRGPAWSSANVRGTGAGSAAVTTIENRSTNTNDITNGPLANRGLHVCTVRTDAAGTFEDSKVKRFIWNLHNRLPRSLIRSFPASAAYAYTGVLRQANADTSAQVEVVIGAQDSVMQLELLRYMNNTSGSSGSAYVAIGTSVALITDGTVKGGQSLQATPVDNYVSEYRATRTEFLGIGHRTLMSLEFCAAPASCTWSQQANSGLIGFTIQ